MTSAMAMLTRSLRGSWRERAACVVEDPELFFPVSSIGSVYTAQVTRAKAVCDECPVRPECLSEALVALPHGIAGGLTADERRDLRRGGRAG